MLKLKVQKQIILDSPSLPWYAETNISKKGGGRYALHHNRGYNIMVKY
jgi:hypothetical protein